MSRPSWDGWLLGISYFVYSNMIRRTRDRTEDYRKHIHEMHNFLISMNRVMKNWISIILFEAIWKINRLRRSMPHVLLHLPSHPTIPSTFTLLLFIIFPRVYVVPDLRYSSHYVLKLENLHFLLRVHCFPSRLDLLEFSYYLLLGIFADHSHPPPPHNWFFEKPVLLIEVSLDFEVSMPST